MHAYMPAGVTEKDARKVTDELQKRLVSLLDLTLTLKHVHWNVVGPGFIGVHEMLDDHVDGVRTMADDVGERIATLGGVPNGLPGFLTEHRWWDDYALGRAPVPAHLAALDKAYDGIVADHRSAFEVIDPIDPVTADLLLNQSRILEMYQWFVRAHLENALGELPGAGTESAREAAAEAVALHQAG